MKKHLLVGLALLAIASCKKANEPLTVQVTNTYFYRLGIESIDGSVAVSQIATARVVSETLGTNGNGNGNNDNHHDDDGCDENDNKFCEKHPWHKKCNKIILPLTLEFFKVQVVDNHALVVWRASLESGINRYFIQRSEDGKNFKNVGFVTPKGAYFTYKYMD